MTYLSRWQTVKSKMTQIIFFCLLLVYYWYFYVTYSKHVEKPLVSAPSNPKPPYNVKFGSTRPNHFQFTVNGTLVWEHTLPVDTFKFYKNKIVAIDPCHGFPDGKLVPTRGKILYEYLKKNPEENSLLKVKENSQFTVQKGDVFYFKCSKGHVSKLEMCPSGTTFTAGTCQPINLCTGQPNGTLLPHIYATQYITCLNGKEVLEKCPDKHIFHHNRCENMNDLNHYCKNFPNRPLVLDSMTRLECRDEKPVFITCKPGTMFFDKDYCEPSICNGVPDDGKIPLPKQNMDPFNFIPGYMTCQNGKIDQTVKCPQYWDEMMSKGDNLTFLPMVFDGEKCSIPSFCENVFADDPDVIVPVHEYSKHVKNWNFSKVLDHAVGFQCEQNSRKRKYVPVDSLISKRFKIQKACEPYMPKKLPIFEDPFCYFDCNSKSLIPCPTGSYFNGERCTYVPENAFVYKNLPVFKFDPLNAESWIQAWDYSKDPAPQCREPESTHNPIYNICVDPDCSNFAFLSQIPNLAILLPGQRARCKYYETEKVLRKEPVDFKYQFWSQKIVNDDAPETCTPGQNIQSGNFIWDKTVYATCNLNQPFVFCPSVHTRRIVPVDSYYACEAPGTNQYVFTDKKWHLFEINEIKRIFPIDPHSGPTYVRINKRSSSMDVPETGLIVPKGERCNLKITRPVKLEVRYRVTHPPNVMYRYEDKQEMFSSTQDHAFLCKLENFTDKPINFPKYKLKPFIQTLNPNLYT